MKGSEEASTPQAVLNFLAIRLLHAQERQDSLLTNARARRGMAQWVLHEYLEGLADGDEL